MKRTISSIDIDSIESPNKRVDLAEYTNPLALPEIFAHVLSYLVYKPKHVVKLAQLSTKCKANMHNAQVWIYLGYRNVISKNGQIDPHVLAVFLRQIDKDRLAKKYVDIQCTWKRYDERWKSRSRELTKDLGEEAKKWLAICDVIDKKYGLKNSLSESFYEQVLANQILSDSVIKAIATMKSNLVPYSDLFRAFRYVLYFPRADLEREAERNKNIPKVAALSSLRIEPICPLLTKLNPPTYLTGLPALFFKDTFIVCHSINSQTHTLSCFFRFCSDGTKAVLFATRGDSQWSGSVDYCKVNLSTKSVESSGCLYRLARQHGQDMEYTKKFGDFIYWLPVEYLKGKYKYSQVTQALVSLFEISIGDEEMKQIDTASWLGECGVCSTLPYKRAKVENMEYSNPLELPEIFAHVLSYLIDDPKHAIKLAKLSTKCNANMHNAIVWVQLGYKSLISKSGHIDKHVLAVFLQQIDRERLTKKYIKIQSAWKSHEDRRNSRSGDTSTNLSPEAKQWLNICDIINKKYGITKSLSMSFYEQVLANKTLSDSVIKSIAEARPNDVPHSALFRAFRYVLYTPRADLELEAERNAGKSRMGAPSERIDVVCPLLLKLYRSHEKTLQQELFHMDCFMVCHSIGGHRSRNCSCFFRYCCGGSKAVIFTTRSDSSWGGGVHYYKVNIPAKLIESSGRLLKLAGTQSRYFNMANDKIPKLKHKFSRLTRELVNLFEMSIDEEEMKQIETSGWLSDCSVGSGVIEDF